jgi:hypothetical protein
VGRPFSNWPSMKAKRAAHPRNIYKGLYFKNRIIHIEAKTYYFFFRKGFLFFFLDKKEAKNQGFRKKAKIFTVTLQRKSLKPNIWVLFNGDL